MSEEQKIGRPLPDIAEAASAASDAAVKTMGNANALIAAVQPKVTAILDNVVIVTAMLAYWAEKFVPKAEGKP